MTAIRSGLAWFALAALVACARAASAPEPAQHPASAPLAPAAPAAPAGRPEIALSRLGPAETAGRERVDLSTATADAAGRCWNFDPDDETAVLYRPLGNGPWTVGAVGAAEPGGLFAVSGIRFPGAGDYELAAALTAAGRFSSGSPIVPATLAAESRARSPILLVHIAALPPPGQRPDLLVVSIGGQALDPRTPTLVPAMGDAVLRAHLVTAGTPVFLAVFSPVSGHAWLHGPASPGAGDEYLLPGVSLALPGEPRTSQLGVLAVAADTLAAGPVELSWLRSQGRLSPSAAVVVEDGPEAGGSWRVPYLAITRIGTHDVDTREVTDPQHLAETGDAVEVGLYERVPAGSQVWILTRPRGSGRWLAQGPALLRGLQAPGEPGVVKPAAWTWLGTRFEHEAPDATEEQSTNLEPFEVRAVLSTSRLALCWSWIDPSSLAGQTVSAPVLVRALPRSPPPPPRIAIARIGAEAPDPEEEAAVGPLERVEASVHPGAAQGAGGAAVLPPPFRVYIAQHPVGDSLWTLVEAMPQGNSYVTPALPFASRDANAAERFELMAVVTGGELPDGQLEYRHLVRDVLARSDLATVRRDPDAGRNGWPAWSRPWALPVAATGATAMWTWLLLLVLLLFTWLALAAVLALPDRRFPFVGPLAARAAARLHQGVRALDGRPGRLQPGKAALFLLGLLLAAVVLLMIVRCYLPVYASAMASVTGLGRLESAGLAVWLILLTALAGIYLELAVEPSHGLFLGRGGLRAAVIIPLGLIVIGLAVFQGLFYSAFLNQASSDPWTPLIGGLAFFLIAAIEAASFFFIARLILPHAGAVAARCIRWLALLMALAASAIAALGAPPPPDRP